MTITFLSDDTDTNTTGFRACYSTSVEQTTVAIKPTSITPTTDIRTEERTSKGITSDLLTTEMPVFSTLDLTTEDSSSPSPGTI